MLTVKCAAVVLVGSLFGCKSDGECVSGIGVAFRVVSGAGGESVCPYELRVFTEDGDSIEIFQPEVIDGACVDFLIPPKVAQMDPGTYLFEVRADGFKSSTTRVQLETYGDCDELTIGALAGQEPSDKIVLLPAEPI